MKKHLLMLASWSMLMYGAISFTSCDKDDDDDDSSVPAVVEKYKDQTGAAVDGDDVVYSKGSQIIVYHFNGDKIESETVYVDYGSSDLAKAAYNEAKNSGEATNVQLNGTVISFTVEIDIEESEFTKQELCDFLNGKLPTNVEDNPAIGGDDEDEPKGEDKPAIGGDDEDEPKGEDKPAISDDNNNLSAAEILNKYSNKSGALIDGDDVVLIWDDSQLAIVHYSGDEIVSATNYTKYDSVIEANARYLAEIADGNEPTVEGTIVVTKMGKSWIDDYQGMTKSELAFAFNYMFGE